MQQTIQIADKPTLDKVKSLLEDSGYGLEALKKIIEQGNNQVDEISLPYTYSITDTISGQTHKSPLISFTNKRGIAYIYDYNRILNGLEVDGVSLYSYFQVFSTREYVYRIPFNNSIKIDTFAGGSSNATIQVVVKYQ